MSVSLEKHASRGFFVALSLFHLSLTYDTMCKYKYQGIPKGNNYISNHIYRPPVSETWYSWPGNTIITVSVKRLFRGIIFHRCLLSELLNCSKRIDFKMINLYYCVVRFSWEVVFECTSLWCMHVMLCPTIELVIYYTETYIDNI